MLKRVLKWWLIGCVKSTAIVTMVPSVVLKGCVEKVVEKCLKRLSRGEGM